jgi:hypothetical protein
LDLDEDHALTEKVIGLAMKVHRTLGPGFLDATNRDYGLLFNFGSAALQFKRKHRRPASAPESADLHHPVNPVNPV